MSTANQSSLSAIVGIIFLVFAVAFLIPAVFLALENPEEQTLTQVETELTTVKYPLTTLINDIDATPAPGSVNLTIANTETGETATIQDLEEGQTESVSFSAGNINITHAITFNSQEALMTYSYPVYIGWPEGAKTLFNNLLLIILLGVLFAIMGMLIIIVEVYKR